MDVLILGVINGKFTSKNAPHIFTFLKDSTFKYEYHAIWYSESSSTWKKIDNFIYLNSFGQAGKIPITYTTEKAQTLRIALSLSILR